MGDAAQRHVAVAQVRGRAAAVTSPASRQARGQELHATPAGDTSAQSMSSSGGPAKTMRQPHRVDAVARPAASPRSTPLPSDLLIALPLVDDLALVQQRG